VNILRDGPKSVPELLRALGSKSLSGAIKKAMGRLDDLRLTALTIPEKPRSKNQKRQLTAKGRRVVKTP
jgi:hypothetical protein